MQYWTDLYKELTDRITANLPQIQWVDLWHEQVNYLTEELPFPTPSIFIAFSTIDINDRGTLVQDLNTQIDMYLFYETFSDTYFGSSNQDRALDFLNCLTRLHALFHGKNGNIYSSMRRTDMQRDSSGGAGNLYRISFQCLVTDYSAQNLFVTSQNPDAELNIEKGDIPPAEDIPPLYDIL